MRYSFAAAALAAVVAAAPAPQGSATSTPTTPSAAAAPAGCQLTYPGSFEIQTVNISSSSKRDLVARQDKPLVVTLKNGILVDDEGRQGYVASNQQFQFNTPVQSNSIYVNGFSVCPNGTLALGNSAVWYQCLSGGFYNLYEESIGAQCTPIYIEIINASGSAPAPVSQQSDGQPTASAGISSAVCEFTDGQPQVTACPQPVTQISDGQIQATTGVPVTQISDGQIQATTGVPVTQISDGQIQATTGVPVTQISDGQIQATTGVPVTQISDGQIQATTGVPVTQISDGQIQATTGVSNVTTPTVQPYTPGSGAAPTGGLRAEILGLAAGVMAVALL